MSNRELHAVVRQGMVGTVRHIAAKDQKIGRRTIFPVIIKIIAPAMRARSSADWACQACNAAYARIQMNLATAGKPPSLAVWNDSPREQGTRGGNFVALPAQQVDRGGCIAVPYIGKVRTGGPTTEMVRTQIERDQAGRAVEP